MKRKCPICRTVYDADPTRLKHGREKTCSKECSRALISRKLRKQKVITCPVCGIPFSVSPSRLQNAKYTPVCSTKCLYKGRTLGIIKREITRPYKITENSRKSWRQAAKQRIGKHLKPPIVFQCETCKKIVSVPRSKSRFPRKQRFCSKECANTGNSGASNPSWRGGNYKEYYGANWKQQQRKARKRDNYTCQGCGKTQKKVGRSLDIHHIRRFADFDNYLYANQLDNLITLCHSCHMKREWKDYPELR
jgi:5-methylcytosine-specific restriction endonuclease McrA